MAWLDYVNKFGTTGSGNGQFNSPRGVAIDDTLIYVTDYNNHRVQVFNKSTYAYVTQFGSSGTGNGQFRYPWGIDVDTNFIYVTDVENDRIQIFNKGSYTYVAQIVEPTGWYYRDVKVDDSFIYNVVSGLNTVEIRNKTSPYAQVGSFGSTGSGNGQFNYPGGIEIDTSYIYVVDENNNRVQIFNKTSPYAYVGQFGSFGAGNGQFNAPTKINVFNSFIYVADSGNNRVQIFNRASPYAYVTQFGTIGSQDGAMSLPSDIHTDSKHIYVLERGNNRTQIFDNFDYGTFNLTQDFTSANDVATKVAVLNDALYILGYSTPAGTTTFRLQARSTQSGAILWDNTDGFIASGGGRITMRGFAVNSTGIYLSGSDPSYLGAGNSAWVLQKRNLSDGSAAWNVYINSNASNEEAYHLVIDDTYMYVCGYTLNPNQRGVVKKRNLSDGAEVWSVSTTDWTWDLNWDGIGQDANYLYLGGYKNQYEGLGGRWAMRKIRKSDGGTEWDTFQNFVSGDVPTEYLTNVVVDSSAVYFSGYEESLGAGNQQGRVQRRNLSTGALLSEYIFNTSTGNESIQAIGIDTTGIYIAAADASVSSGQWRIQKLNLALSTVLWDMQADYSAYADVPRGLTVTADALYVCGYDRVLGSANTQWRIQKRSLDSGVLLETMLFPTAPSLLYLTCGI